MEIASVLFRYSSCGLQYYLEVWNALLFYSKQNAFIHTTFTLWLVCGFSFVHGICIMYKRRKSKLKTKPKRCSKNSVIRLLFSVPTFLVVIFLRLHHHHTESKLIACFLSIISCNWLLAKVKFREHYSYLKVNKEPSAKTEMFILGNF